MFLTDFNDQRTSNWSSQEIYGKMDPIYTYKNTGRKVSIAFDIPSYSLIDAKKNTKYVIDLQDSMYPVYAEREGELGAANLSSPPLFRIYITNLFQESNNSQQFKGVLGWIDNINYKPEFESGFFIDKNDNINNFYPKLLKLSFSFNVIHEKPLGYNQNHQLRILSKKQYDSSAAANTSQTTTPVTTPGSANQAAAQNTSATPGISQ